MRKGILLSLLLLVIFFFSAGAQETCPQVIPSLKEWKGGNGKLSLKKKGKLVIPPEYRSKLVAGVEQFKSDLLEMSGMKYEVKYGKPSKGDIYFTLNFSQKSLGEEGYQINIGDYVRVEAPTKTGAFWATRTLLQMIVSGGTDFPKGEIRDYPDYARRGFMLDCGRKFFPLQYLKDYVRILSFYKMNEFQIHLNDNGFVEFFDNDWSKTYSAFRLESTKFPGLTAKDGSYTKNEFRDLQQEAQYFGVNIIPEIDIPAHSLAFSQFKPEIGSKEYGMDHLDLYNPETYKFVDALLDEYIGGDNPVFIGKDVHIGTDEYNKKEAEKYRYFTDRYLKFVESYHKQPRMWGGLKWLAGKTPVKSKGVIVNAWSADWVDPVQSLKDGYELINTCDGFLYIVPGAGYYQDFLNTEWIYNNWSVTKLSSDITLTKDEPGLSGAMFAVWNDHCGNGISQKDVHLRTMPALQTLAQKMWNDAGKPADYAAFNKLCKGMIEAPGLNLSGRVNGKTDVVLKYDLVKPKAKDLSGNEFNVKKRKDNVIETQVYEVGYPYSVQFDLNLSSNNNKDVVLFGNDYAKVYANWNGTGKIAFSREGYTFNFDTVIPANEWVNLRIDGTVNGMKLYINGKQVEELMPKERECAKLNGGSSKMYYQFTSFFPLQFIGDKTTGFKGEMKNLMVKQEKYLNLLYNPARFLK